MLRRIDEKARAGASPAPTMTRLCRPIRFMVGVPLAGTLAGDCITIVIRQQSLSRVGPLGKEPARWRGTEGYLSPRQGSRKGPHISTQWDGRIPVPQTGFPQGAHISPQPPLPLQPSKGL